MPMIVDDPKRAVLVSSLMTREVESVESRTKLADIRELFAERALHHLPVVDGERLIGLISVTDLLRLGADPDRQSTFDTELRARHIMLERESIITASEHTTVHDAAAMLGDGFFHALPVVDADDRLLGIVTSTDLILYLVDLLEAVNRSDAANEASA